MKNSRTQHGWNHGKTARTTENWNQHWDSGNEKEIGAQQTSGIH